MWNFFELVIENSRFVYRFVGESKSSWPMRTFKRKAEKLGYETFKKDGTIIGGYFVKQNGDCLFCAPNTIAPEDYF